MVFENFRTLKSYIILCTISFLLLFTVTQDALAQLEVFDKNPNYLTYNGEPILLMCSVPNGQDFHVMDFDINFITQMKNYGGNHIWVMIENFTAIKWSYTKNTPDAFYDKIGAIARVAYENDVIFGISLFGYGLVRYPWNFSFNAACSTHCGNDPGPLKDPMDFYDATSNDSAVVAARDVQKTIMRKIIERTWQYPNVYYSPGWEIKVIWNYKVAEWFKWATDYMEDQGHIINPNIDHLFAIEKTMDPMEAFKVGADFVIDEDGNAYKSEGIPFVYWSMDGVYRGLDFWNQDELEPTRNWDFMREELISGAAGLATIWGVDPEEEDYMQSLANFASTVENWCDEPGQEITNATVPLTYNVAGTDLPGSNDCEDITDYSSFQISNINVSSGRAYVQDFNVNINRPFYIDRTYTVAYIPPDYRGLIWLKTANDDKRNEDANFMSYTVNQDVTVYVGYDTRIAVKPGWLQSWTSTQDYITDDTGVEFELMQKDFTKGTITLGSNQGSSGSMYIILHMPTGEVDLSPPAPPQGIYLRTLFE
ncbi:hypothetical protein JXQ31_11625 [candidate division KSB1 bacterium]|nr:hypothetical protein [candidate division KSB1 bacterium]